MTFGRGTAVAAHRRHDERIAAGFTDGITARAQYGRHVGHSAAAGGDGDTVVECGPLSVIALRDGDAALIRLIPSYPGQTAIDLIEMPRPGSARANGNGADPLGEALRQHGDSIAAAPLDRPFYDWYWPLLEPAMAQ